MRAKPKNRFDDSRPEAVLVKRANLWMPSVFRVWLDDPDLVLDFHF